MQGQCKICGDIFDMSDLTVDITNGGAICDNCQPKASEDDRRRGAEIFAKILNMGASHD